MKKKKKIQWHQISQRQRVSPFPNYMSMESITKEMKGVIGYSYLNMLLFFKENFFWGFFDKKEYGDLGKKVLKKVLADPLIFQKIIKKEKKFAKSFIRFIKTNRKSLNKLSNPRLLKIHKQYEKEYKRIYSHYFVILTVENNLVNFLKKYLDRLIKDTKKAGHYLDILISEPRAFVAQQENLAALKLMVQIASRKKWATYFKKKNPKEIEIKVRRDKELSRLIQKHERNYFWITRDYEDPVLTFSDFIKRFRKELKGNPKKKLDSLEKEIKGFSQKRKSIEKELSLDSYHKKLFAAIRDGMYLKELRKMIVSQSLYYYDPILAEIAKRGGLSLNQVRHLRTCDIEEMLLQDKDYSDEANERIKLSVFWVQDGKTKILIKKQAQRFFQKLLTIPKEVKEIKGFPASSGTAEGMVKIVMHPWEGKKVKKGDIIVTAQAVPSFSPIIQKAAALLADGGTGITSHPATLAREADIPCITGLKIATRVLHDGDKVEVNADKGIVKIIK